jgi:flagellin-specific chaperone FliS
MHPYLACQPRPAGGLARLDLVLALLDGLIDRAEQAARLLGQGDGSAARSVLVNARGLLDRLVGSGAAGGSEVTTSLLHLYDFVGRRLGTGRVEQVEESLPILRRLRDGFMAIRAQALELERQGLRGATDRPGPLQASA